MRYNDHMKTLLLIDAHAMIHPCKYSDSLHTKDGAPTTQSMIFLMLQKS
jgi:hypothetical protein